MKHRILLIFGILIFLSSILSAKLIHNEIYNGGGGDDDEEVKVLVIERNGQLYKIIKIADRLAVVGKNKKSSIGYLGKLTDEGKVVLIDYRGMIIKEIQIDEIIQISYNGIVHTMDSDKTSLKIETRIITAKKKRRRNILGKTVWTVLGIAATALTFKYFVNT